MHCVSSALAACLIAAVSAYSALAHVVLEQPAGTLGKSYKAVLKVTHGCEGSPTVKLTVDIPEGVIAVKPMPKQGWTIEMKRGPYAQGYAFYHGRTLAEGVRQITWSGGNLPDDYYDEFVFSAFLAKELPAGTTLYFPSVQTCEKGENRWVEIPEAGKETQHLASPAARLKLIPGEHEGHKH